ncbi:ribonuclease R [Fusobacterium simiae]|uniref:ribonuclease R n=1 Tax=Fusobacterium TaxID=848 RepID=UPI001896DAA5|nr:MULTISPECIES: ribonuclease R [Fusobacterium]MDC7954665.1 ribonuclease R [Fusobacterium simiae]
MNLEKDLEKIKELLKDVKYLTLEQITNFLDWSPKNKKDNKAIVLSWVDSGDLILDKKHRLSLPENSGYVKGIFRIIKNKFAFVDREDSEEKEGIFIPKEDFNNALDGDTVLVKITGLGRDSSGKIGEEGEVVKIITHGKNTIVGILEKGKNFAFVIPTGSFGKDIYIPNSKIANADNKDLVAVEITFWGDNNRKPEGKIIKVLGSSTNSKNMIEALIYREGLSEKFSDEAMRQTNDIIKNSKMDYSNRKDLTKLSIITIDGADAKDLDDAVYVEKLENGNYKLIVSIADVSYYVKKDSVLDLEARNRGNSVYLVDRVLPMFPKEISNGICSLNEKEEKLTFSCEMEIDLKGDVINYEVYKSVIKSVHRMTYKDVNAILDGDKDIINEYSNIHEMLKQMLELSKILRAKKHKRGSIDFELPELKVVLDKDEKVEKVYLKDRGEGEKIIEDFMIAANETVAERIFWLELASIYRTHEKPDREKIFRLNEILAKFGYKIPNFDNLHPKQFQEIIERSKDKETSMIVHKTILTSLKQARYTVEDIGHFGLSSSHYTHFTSPIRRYADLMVHRILFSTIDNSVKPFKVADLEEIAQHISKTERVAMKAEDESVRIKLVEYMQKRVGETLTVMVTGFAPRKVFFETDEHIECSWDVTTAINYYVFDEENYCMRDTYSDTVFYLGDKVDVILKKADLLTLEIAVMPLDDF